MNKKVDIVLNMWHEHFAADDHQYSEFEKSDIEYFVACLLYNHFNFSKALQTMQTMDLSYDFIENCTNEYDEIQESIKSINLEDDIEKLNFLFAYINEIKPKYNNDELYLINRFEYHIKEMATRYEADIKAKAVEFKSPPTRSPNPLDRI